MASVSQVFRRIGAPLKNMRWSWGAVSDNGDVYLKVWADEFDRVDGRLWARLTRHSAFAQNPGHPGWLERKRHVAMVQQGAKSFAIKCRAKDTNANPRTIASIDDKRLFIGGAVCTDSEGDSWLELVETRRL